VSEFITLLLSIQMATRLLVHPHFNGSKILLLQCYLIFLSSMTYVNKLNALLGQERYRLLSVGDKVEYQHSI
jgi:hypothetical protein